MFAITPQQEMPYPAPTTFGLLSCSSPVSENPTLLNAIFAESPSHVNHIAAAPSYVCWGWEALHGQAFLALTERHVLIIRHCSPDVPTHAQVGRVVFDLVSYYAAIHSGDLASLVTIV